MGGEDLRCDKDEHPYHVWHECSSIRFVVCETHIATPNQLTCAADSQGDDHALESFEGTVRGMVQFSKLAIGLLCDLLLACAIRELVQTVGCHWYCSMIYIWTGVQQHTYQACLAPLTH